MCAKHIQSNAQERQTDRLKCQSVKISFMGRPSGGNRFDSPMNLNLEPGTKPWRGKQEDLEIDSEPHWQPVGKN